MNDGLIRVREFAQNCGCTPQNIYGHLKTYATELDGHTFQGKGRQGVLLDGFAQDFLRSVMYPKEIADNALMEEINELRAQLLQMGVKNTELASRLAAAEGERDRAVLEAGSVQRALAASEAETEARKAELDQARLEAQEATQKAQEAEQRADQAAAERDAEKARNEALMGRGLFARIFNKGV